MSKYDSQGRAQTVEENPVNTPKVRSLRRDPPLDDKIKIKLKIKELSFLLTRG